jgi:hypothetical protein
MASMPGKADVSGWVLGTGASSLECQQSLLSDHGSCSKCAKEFPFFELQPDSDGASTCPSCLAAGDTSRLDALQALEEGNACSKCGVHMPGIGSVAKVMCARCRV